MSTAWTTEEYGRVARALLYPLARVLTRTNGYLAFAQNAELFAQLEQLDQSAKDVILAAADRLIASTSDYYAAASRNPNIERVGDIVFGNKGGMEVRAHAIEAMRNELANMAGIPINPDGCRVSGGPSMNATWTTLCPSTPKPSRARPARSWKSLRPRSRPFGARSTAWRAFIPTACF